ncbi:hypothetical protein Q8A73_007496 [Channa argus]|nr:hypothetical protein Q8A73_007496 [Channa argus]
MFLPVQNRDRDGRAAPRPTSAGGVETVSAARFLLNCGRRFTAVVRNIVRADDSGMSVIHDKALEPGQTCVTLCRASQRVRPHLKQPGVAALKPPFRAGPGTTAKTQKRHRLQPAAALKPVSSQTKFVTSPPLHTPRHLRSGGKKVPGGEQLQTSRFVNGAFNDCTTVTCTLNFLLRRSKAPSVAGLVQRLWRLIWFRPSMRLMVQLQHAAPIRQITQESEKPLLRPPPPCDATVNPKKLALNRSNQQFQFSF